MRSRFAIIRPLAVSLVVLASLAFAIACSDDDGDNNDLEPTTTAAAAETPDATVPAGETPSTGGPPPIDGEVTDLPSGLRIIEYQSVPDTDVAEAGDTISVHYTGWLADGTQFDSSVGGQPLSFQLGSTPLSVIPGFDEGIQGMTVGSKRRLMIPAELGYGEGGSPPVIPANADLIFDVELVGVE
jgi:FKBP-type peptidyl-prolyl cis-trans isomerase